MPSREALRALPSVDELLNQAPLREARAQLGHDLALRAARQTLQAARERLLLTADDSAPPVAPELAEAAARQAWTHVHPSLRQVINATGVILHTNLGRAPLCQSALDAVASIGRGYSSLELSMAKGGRGERHSHVEAILCELLDAEAALVVNNNASAVLLMLTALAKGKEVILSRSQAVEIGGAFRVPDIMRRSGAKLVEVGTTNRTYLADYENAVSGRTAALLSVHSSNFRIVGFTHAVNLEELGELSRRLGVPLLDDNGSGCLVDTTQFGLAAEPTVQKALAAGAALVCFSGDKLLGGPQAGLIVGRKEFVDRLKRDPLARALRIDKLTLAALHATLVEYLKGTALQALPVWRMVGYPLEHLQQRAEVWAREVPGSEVIAGHSTVGGGSLPEETLPTALLALPRPKAAARTQEKLRRHDPPVIARIEADRVLLDPRTVQEWEDRALFDAIHFALS